MSSFKRHLRLHPDNSSVPEVDKHDPFQFLKYCYDNCMKEEKVLTVQTSYEHNFSLKQIQEQFETWDLDETK